MICCPDRTIVLHYRNNPDTANWRCFQMVPSYLQEPVLGSSHQPNFLACDLQGHLSKQGLAWYLHYFVSAFLSQWAPEKPPNPPSEGLLTVSKTGLEAPGPGLRRRTKESHCGELKSEREICTEAYLVKWSHSECLAERMFIQNIVRNPS